MAGVSHLYIHIPFCRSRCGYCDFYSETAAEGLMEPYVDALLSELEESAGLTGELETVYLGGGTPTLLGAGLVQRLLEGVRERARVAAGAEVTVEANPGTVTPELAAGLLAAGVNRVSLGVQSFEPGLRANLGRAGEADAVARAVAALRSAGLGNVGLDMIFGIPGQSAVALARDLEAVLSLAPEHISYYELTVKEGTAFARRWADELEKMETSGRSAEFYEQVAGTLEAAGYRWYETSNYARPGFECRHNLAYWQGADYLGLGAGAWSTVGMSRWRNAEGLSAYIAAAGPGAAAEAPGAAGPGAAAGTLDAAKPGQATAGRASVRAGEILSRAQKTRERLLLGLRREAGVSLPEVAGAVDPEQLKYLQQCGFLQSDGDRISLTRAGRFVANEVCARLLSSCEN